MRSWFRFGWTRLENLLHATWRALVLQDETRPLRSAARWRHLALLQLLRLVLLLFLLLVMRLPLFRLLFTLLLQLLLFEQLLLCLQLRQALFEHGELGVQLRRVVRADTVLVQDLRSVVALRTQRLLVTQSRNEKRKRNQKVSNI